MITGGIDSDPFEMSAIACLSGKWNGCPQSSERGKGSEQYTDYLLIYWSVVQVGVL